MCGIYGAITSGKDESVATFLEQSAIDNNPRGPDDGGIVSLTIGNQRVHLGHRRLSILDLTSKSRQPMSAADASVSISFNGEIYNFLELRRELEGLGIRFATTGDTEVLLRAYMQWGLQAVHRMNGMFAIAIADFNKRCLHLVRDRFGVKPLFFQVSAGQLYFFSGTVCSSRRRK